MKKLIVAIYAITAVVSTFADTADPVADYKNAKALTAADVLYKWVADLNGDGHSEVLLNLKEAYQEDEKDRQVPSWRVYVATTNGTFSMVTGVEDDMGVGPALPQIDPESCFVGQITQLGKRGIVTMKIDNPREGESVATIYAYTVEGNHLKYTQLAQYQPGQPNAVFDQYLKDNVRTQVQLQEVTP